MQHISTKHLTKKKKWPLNKTLNSAITGSETIPTMRARYEMTRSFVLFSWELVWKTFGIWCNKI